MTRYKYCLTAVLLSLSAACAASKTSQISAHTELSNAKQQRLDTDEKQNTVLSYTRLLMAFFMEPKCHLMTKDEFIKFYLNAEASTAALVRYNVISAAAMDTNIARHIDASADRACDNNAKKDIAFANEHAEKLTDQINVQFGKGEQWKKEEVIYTLRNAIARQVYTSVASAWHIESNCKFFTSEQNRAWQEQAADMTKQYLDQGFLKEDEIKKAQQNAYILTREAPCNQNSKSIVMNAFKASSLSKVVSQ